jgi:hypothetical protein
MGVGVNVTEEHYMYVCKYNNEREFFSLDCCHVLFLPGRICFYLRQGLVM